VSIIRRNRSVADDEAKKIPSGAFMVRMVDSYDANAICISQTEPTIAL
jgi:hypothetical protein